jgi:hypothetical protein
MMLVVAPTRRLACVTAVVLLVVVSCGNSPPAVTGGSPAISSSPAALPTPSPLFTLTPGQFGHLPAASPATLKTPPQVTCSGDVGATDPVAIVTIRGQAGVYLRDYVDAANPRNFCVFGLGIAVTEILDPHHVVIESPVPAVIELPSGAVFELGIHGKLVAVAPDMSQVLWMSSANPPTLHASWDAGDVVIQQYPPAGKPCGDADTASRYGAFSRDARYGYALWDQGPATATYLNVVSNRASAFALPPPAAGWGSSGGPRMAVWSPVSDRLYYERQGSLWTWTPSAGAAQLKSGLRWIDPTISPDGTRIAYAVRGANGLSIVHVMDAASGADRGTVSTDARKRPFFLTNDLIWLKGDEKGCTVNVRSPFVYDLRDQTETQSSLDQVSATWPSTSALGG